MCLQDSLDLLAEFMGVGEQVAALTNEAMDGTMALGESLEQRLNLLNCTPADIKRFIQKYPPKTRLVPVRAVVVVRGVQWWCGPTQPLGQLCHHPLMRCTSQHAARCCRALRS